MNETPFGIRVTIFDNINCRESGIFYTINEKQWVRKDVETNKKKKKYILDNLLDEKYYLNFVLKEIGYYILMDSVNMKASDVEINLQAKTAFNRNSIINQLENVLSINNIINCFEKKNFIQ